MYTKNSRKNNSVKPKEVQCLNEIEIKEANNKVTVSKRFSPNEQHQLAAIFRMKKGDDSNSQEMAEYIGVLLAEKSELVAKKDVYLAKISLNQRSIDETQDEQMRDFYKLQIAKYNASIHTSNLKIARIDTQINSLSIQCTNRIDAPSLVCKENALDSHQFSTILASINQSNTPTGAIAASSRENVEDANLNPVVAKYQTLWLQGKKKLEKFLEETEETNTSFNNKK